MTNISSRTLALGGISVLAAAALAVGTEVTKSLLHEIQNARAATIAANAATVAASADTEKAIAEREKAKAERVAAENILNAAKETRIGTMVAASFLAKAQETSAKIAGQAQVKSMEIDRYVDNVTFDGFLRPILVDPSEKMHRLNGEIERLKRDVESGVDSRSGLVLPEEERRNRMVKAQMLENEHAIVSATSAKDFSDSVNLIMNGMGQAFGGFGNLYPTGKEPVVVRRIVQEQ